MQGNPGSPGPERNGKVMKVLDVKFGTMRDYCSKIGKVIVYLKDKDEGENYQCIDEVPESYNDYYVFGFGPGEGTFYDEEQGAMNFYFGVEIILTEQPRVIQQDEDKE